MKLVAFVSLLFIARESSAEYEISSTTGPIEGKLSSYPELLSTEVPGVVEYLGIPYAEPPTKPNRFKPPVPIEAWSETLQAIEYGAVCPQDDEELGKLLSNPMNTYEEFLEDDVEVDEDCLFLNVYAPAQSDEDGEEEDGAKRSIMVFLHPGGFSSGSGMLYNGAMLSALHDVIVVTVNYRLGALGFLSDGTPGLAGNYGIMDQQMALEWIKENAEEFGGDPDSITIFGSGAGGSSAHLHSLTEGSRGLFKRLIVQSASYDDEMLSRESAQAQYEDLIQKLGITSRDSMAEQLQNITVEDILAASANGTWRPSISDMFPTNPREAKESGSFNEKVNMLVGSNSLDSFDIVDGLLFEEGWYYDAVLDVTKRTSEFYNWSESEVEERMQVFNSFYGGFGSDIESMPQALQTRMTNNIFTDQIYSSWAHEIASMQSKDCDDCDVYKYHFERSFPSGDDSGDLTLFPGARTGGELPYIFGFHIDSDDDDDDDEQLSRDVMEKWTEFAETGKIADFDSFKHVTSGDSCRKSIIFGKDGSIIQQEDRETSRNYDFWLQYYDTLGLSCLSEDFSNIGIEGFEEEDEEDECEDGVWSNAGIEMSNATAGALLTTFIVLTIVFLLSCLLACHKLRKSKRRMKKLLREDNSSVLSNRMSTM